MMEVGGGDDRAGFFVHQLAARQRFGAGRFLER
jgi:hypothetical protein